MGEIRNTTYYCDECRNDLTDKECLHTEKFYMSKIFIKEGMNYEYDVASIHGNLPSEMDYRFCDLKCLTDYLSLRIEECDKKYKSDVKELVTK